MSNVPAISVLMPVYNAERYLGQAVKSVLAQTFADFELVIIDDGSTDGTADVLKEHARRDARVRVISRPNTGIVGALNDGLAVCRGRYIARMDGDDIALPLRFEMQLRYLDEHPECVLVGSAVVQIDPDGDPLKPLAIPTEHDAILEGMLRGEGFLIVHPAVMMRREAVTAVGGYRKEYELVEDYDLFFRLAEIGRMANLDEVLLHYRQHLTSTGLTRTAKQQRVVRAVLEEARRRRNLPMIECGKLADAPPDLPSLLRTWGWWALMSGWTSVARKHSWRALKHEPGSIASWKLMLCALRGH